MKHTVRASLDILKKMVDLDPDNVSSRIKLAELYARESMNSGAASATGTVRGAIGRWLASMASSAIASRRRGSTTVGRESRPAIL